MPVDDPEIQAAAQSIFEDMLADMILDVTISAQREIKRGRVVCGTCGTRCRAHLPLIPSNGAGPSNSLAPQDSSSFSSSRAASPASAGPSSEGRSGGYKVGPEKGTGGSTGIGSGSGKIDTNGNAFFDCLVCNRAIASTRYAPHLSSCLGLNGSTRRTAARSAAVKARLGANDRSSPSPYAQSENGDSDNESVSSKKGKKLLNGNGKRGRSPSKTPSVMGKKSKFSSGTATPSAARPLLPPSKLGQPPTNRPPTQLSSPVSSGSPEFSIVSSQGTSGTTSKKKLPEPDFGKRADADDVAGGGEYVPGDESSDEGADDY